MVIGKILCAAILGAIGIACLWLTWGPDPDMDVAHALGARFPESQAIPVRAVHVRYLGVLFTAGALLFLRAAKSLSQLILAGRDAGASTPSQGNHALNRAALSQEEVNERRTMTYIGPCVEVVVELACKLSQDQIQGKGGLLLEDITNRLMQARVGGLLVWLVRKGDDEELWIYHHEDVQKWKCFAFCVTGKYDSTTLHVHCTSYIAFGAQSIMGHDDPTPYRIDKSEVYYRTAWKEVLVAKESFGESESVSGDYSFFDKKTTRQWSDGWSKNVQLERVYVGTDWSSAIGDHFALWKGYNQDAQRTYAFTKSILLAALEQHLGPGSGRGRLSGKKT